MNLKKCFAIGLSITSFFNSLAADTKLTDSEAEAIAVDGYIYGYPLVTMDMTRRVMTNVEAPIGNKAPMGQFASASEFVGPTFKDVTAPNTDTLYSTAWLDLSEEPYILHVPKENGRYYLMPMLSGWTDVFASPGSRTTGTDMGDYAITGPGWKGKLPSGVVELKSPTNLVWILGRTYTSGTSEDYQVVHIIQKQYRLTPLSQYGKNYEPPKGEVDPYIDTETPVRAQVNALEGPDFFKLLARLMKNNPALPEDAQMIARLAKIGFVPGQDYATDSLDPTIKNALAKAPAKALEKIIEYQKKAPKIENGWVFSLQTGTYGTDYLQRAMIAAIGLGANLPEDAIYPYTKKDAQGQTLTGAYDYVVHFPMGETPPVNGFWSLTLYNSEYFLVANPLNRYSISPRNTLKYNPDGSLDLYIQNKSPGKDKESNWLPSPKDDFILMLRFYWPRESIIKGDWKPPAVKRVEKPSSPAATKPA